ncbi:hypothetical protein DCC81_24660 [Chitinophaga parva]|uniref:Uncharacterized protein n=1 Tax=Chitinophaga parva TaxID=2169414 RepID=A0A2T7BBN3_9BACT|nr:hypothetical protein [Chitinophaga parva]PUZ21783.1 hypothetical protein DCC81_24660 [Chitinophaga parva]
MSSVESILPKVEKRYLRYDFTAVELHEKSQELAAKNLEIVNVENEKKEATGQFTSRIASIKSSIGQLSDKVANGYEIREVTLDVQYHTPKQGYKTLIRKDTGKRIEEKMTDSDWNLWTQYDEANKPTESQPADVPDIVRTQVGDQDNPPAADEEPF